MDYMRIRVEETAMSTLIDTPFHKNPIPKVQCTIIRILLVIIGECISLVLGTYGVSEHENIYSPLPYTRALPAGKGLLLPIG